jgi:hypothetical protein
MATGLILYLLVASNRCDWQEPQEGVFRPPPLDCARSDPRYQLEPRSTTEAARFAKAVHSDFQIATSAQRCAAEDARARVTAAIAKEHLYSEETGVVDLVRLQHLKELLMMVDATREQAEQRLAQRHLKPWQCNSTFRSQLVLRTTLCLSIVFTPKTGDAWRFGPEHDSADCRATEVAAMVSLASQSR